MKHSFHAKLIAALCIAASLTGCISIHKEDAEPVTTTTTARTVTSTPGATTVERTVSY